MFPINNVIRSVMRTKEDTLKCLVFCRENEKYLKSLSKCNCELYVIPKPNQSDWKESVATASADIFVLKNDQTALGFRPFFDCIIANDRLQEFDLALSASRHLHIPIITVDHVSQNIIQKLPASSNVQAGISLENRVGNINVSMSEEIKKTWNSNSHGISIVIPPYIESHPSPDEEEILLRTKIVIDNNVPQPIMNAIQSTLSKVDVSPRFPEHSVENIKDAQIYINTWNNIDTKTLEAMLMGCITISHRTPDTEMIIRDKENGLLFSDFSELSEIIKKCKEGAYNHIPKEAIKTAKESSVDEESFVKKWNQVLSYTSEAFFLRN